MITIVYCTNHVPKNIVAAGDCNGVAGFICGQCQLTTGLAEIADVDEPNIGSGFPHVCKDLTVVEDVDAWFVFLRDLYVP